MEVKEQVATVAKFRNGEVRRFPAFFLLFPPLIHTSYSSTSLLRLELRRKDSTSELATSSFASTLSPPSPGTSNLAVELVTPPLVSSSSPNKTAWRRRSTSSTTSKKPR